MIKVIGRVSRLQKNVEKRRIEAQTEPKTTVQAPDAKAEEIIKQIVENTRIANEEEKLEEEIILQDTTEVVDQERKENQYYGEDYAYTEDAKNMKLWDPESYLGSLSSAPPVQSSPTT
jgi:hypothetical protein